LDLPGPPPGAVKTVSALSPRWGRFFCPTIWVENGGYSEFQYFRLIGGLIAQTMPEGWSRT
jgi:hypothetical protein